MAMLILLCLCFMTCGVFGVKVSVMEGESVTLQTDIRKQKDDRIVWYYGPENTFIARVNGKASSSMLSDDERFRDRVMVDNQTGDLIIKNIRPEHTGDYTLKIRRNNDITYLYKKFNLTVYAHLSVPVISSHSSHKCSSLSSSVSNCVLLCSVLNVRDVSLSWYKGNSLLSSISVSDLKTNASLHLEIEYQDTNTYRCVLNNTITNQTQHLNNIKNLCQCSDTPVQRVFIISVVLNLVLFCVIIIIITVVYIHKIALIANHKKTLCTKVPLNNKEKIRNFRCTTEVVNGKQKSYMHVNVLPN